MQKSFFVLTMLLLGSRGVAFADPQTIIAAREQQLGIANTDMYTFIQWRDILATIEEQCAFEAIELALQYEDTIQDKLTDYYNARSSADVLAHSWDIYEHINRVQDDIRNYSPKNYCALKHIFYRTQDFLRDKHMAVLEDIGIMKDFEGFSDLIYGYQTKLEYLDALIERNQKYPGLLGTKLVFTYLNGDFKQDLSNGERELLDRIQALMEVMVAEALYSLLQEWVFTQADIDILKNKVTFQFVESCDVFHGKYEIKETLTSQWEHVKYDTEQLLLKINYCTNFFVLRDLEHIFQKIITHELAHHFYYYHDTDVDAFHDICWVDEDTKNGQCKSSDYVSEYAQTLAVEDYAEQFMHRFLGIIPVKNTIINQKTAHFSQMIK